MAAGVIDSVARQPNATSVSDENSGCAFHRVNSNCLDESTPERAGGVAGISRCCDSQQQAIPEHRQLH